MRMIRKKLVKILWIGMLLFILYVFLGIVISYHKQPEIREDYRDSFDVSEFYSDRISCDRACIIEDNTQALEERLRMIETAKERIILSTFEFRADESGKDVIAALIQAAERGVDIKILADGPSAFLQMDGNPYFHALAASENVEIKIYNRLNLLMPWKSMGRLHDKYVIVDDYLYLLGGRNTYDYFLGDNGYKNYDRDVLVYTTDPDDGESSIHQLEAYFKGVWELDECKTFRIKGGGAGSEKIKKAAQELEERYRSNLQTYSLTQERPDYEAMTYEVNKITLLSNPTHVYAKEPTLFYALTELMKDAKGEILIHTPYVICNEWMYQCFAEICAKNPQVFMLTNSVANNGNPFGASDYAKNKGRLVDTGMTIYEYEGGISYHGKSIAVGDKISVIGSFNMDIRSVYLDTELMLVIDSEDVNRQLKEYLRAYEKDAVKVLDEKRYEIPEGITRQEISGKKALRVKILKLFNWLRFLM